jgi:hypothetical protein
VAADLETLRRELGPLGLPPAVVDRVLLAAGSLVMAIDDLAALDLGDLEPFAPALRLPEDATE